MKFRKTKFQVLIFIKFKGHLQEYSIHSVPGGEGCCIFFQEKPVFLPTSHGALKKGPWWVLYEKGTPERFYGGRSPGFLRKCQRIDTFRSFPIESVLQITSLSTASDILDVNKGPWCVGRARQHGGVIIHIFLATYMFIGKCCLYRTNLETK